MTNDTSTLNGALQELGETMASNLTSQGVTASASDGLTTLANKIPSIEHEEVIWEWDGTTNVWNSGTISKGILSGNTEHVFNNPIELPEHFKIEYIGYKSNASYSWYIRLGNSNNYLYDVGNLASDRLLVRGPNNNLLIDKSIVPSGHAYKIVYEYDNSTKTHKISSNNTTAYTATYDGGNITLLKSITINYDGQVSGIKVIKL